MQMQTFVTQPDDAVEGFDGYNGDLTGDVAATLGVNCGMSTGRNGVMAFAANQRDEVREMCIRDRQDIYENGNKIGIMGG